jgi:hypothetical protein
MNTKKTKKRGIILSLVIIGVVLTFSAIFVNAASNYPQGPDTLTSLSNSTRATVGPKVFNSSGGYISTLNLSANIQDTRWKAFVGYVSGAFTLQDSAGYQIYNWQLLSITGRVYACRNSSTVSWTNLNCSNITTLNAENVLLSHTNPNDNLNMTFNYTTNATHDGFYVGPKYFLNDSCPTLNTYVNSLTQDTSFEEMALYDNYNIVYATIVEPRIAGYNGTNYDFQMIVPEVGDASFSGSTAYYLYAEIGV